MDIINKCFDGVVLVKVENKEGFSIYAAALNSSFGDGNKQYILAFVPEHLSILEKAHLGELQWENVQTRLLSNGYKLPTGKSMPQQKWVIPKGVENFMFNIKNRDESKSRYSAEGHPLELILIHDPKKKSQYQYHNKFNLLAALSSFRCVISCTFGTGGGGPGSVKGVPITSLYSNTIHMLPHGAAPKTAPREISSNGYSMAGKESCSPALPSSSRGVPTTIKSAIRYQSVASASNANLYKSEIHKQSLYNLAETTSIVTNEDGRGQASMPLGASKMKRQANQPYPWISKNDNFLQRLPLPAETPISNSVYPLGKPNPSDYPLGKPNPSDYPLGKPNPSDYLLKNEEEINSSFDLI
jgi:hypothetical protein